jgi:hypothetical protein
MDNRRIGAGLAVLAAAAAKPLAASASPELGAIVEDVGKGGIGAVVILLVLLVAGLRTDVQALGSRLSALEGSRPRRATRRRRPAPARADTRSPPPS